MEPCPGLCLAEQKASHILGQAIMSCTAPWRVVPCILPPGLVACSLSTDSATLRSSLNQYSSRAATERLLHTTPGGLPGRLHQSMKPALQLERPTRRLSHQTLFLHDMLLVYALQTLSMPEESVEAPVGLLVQARSVAALLEARDKALSPSIPSLNWA